MGKKNSKKERKDLLSLSHLGERFFIYLSMEKKFEKKTERENLPSLSKKDIDGAKKIR